MMISPLSTYLEGEDLRRRRCSELLLELIAAEMVHELVLLSCCLKMSGTAAPEEDKKPVDQSAHINLKVKGQDGNEVFFRIKRSTQLRKLMTAYCDRQSVEFNSIAFLFDGRRLRGEQTPDELEMEDGDEIDAMLHQTGGGCAGF
ncbi:hypothetical protein HHK36_020297 [Tetracentron sinense]|uniref:Ubiquitin-like domain-containing protein n=1 Tax=Tetracentron sinense TaxID=13715 RepID=A0A834YTF9_TETSI|nr:hypothetical protein HHK36_020297 [Tetracentron sinense]